MAQGNISQANKNEVRMVLLGKTGNGKSSLGNTILGEKKFEARRSPKSVTKQCSLGERMYKNKKLTVIDTPGFFDTNATFEETRGELTETLTVSAPGPNVFLVVLDLKRFTKEEQEASELITKIYGSGVVHYCFIVFTGLDILEEEGTTIEEYLNDLSALDPLSLLLNQYGRRYMAINNKGTAEEKEKALETLLHEIEEMLRKNGTEYFTSDLIEDVNVEIEKLKAAGEFHPVNADGSIVIYAGPKKIVGGHLRRNVGKSSVKN